MEEEDGEWLIESLEDKGVGLRKWRYQELVFLKYLLCARLLC